MCRDRRSGQQAIYNPKQCPFTIRQLNNNTWLVRENDQYGEYPHIYIRKCTQGDVQVLVITDTGVGTAVSCGPDNKNWTIASFIQHHLNPTNSIPYLIILSHCHYDHILGLSPLLASSAHVTILSSSHSRAFTTPHTNLQEHSLCASMHLDAPKYATQIWAADAQDVEYTHPSGVKMALPIRTFHTPGHTPDSLSWLDSRERILYVGDSFYSSTSPDSESAAWGPESPAPILFPNEGDLSAWWRGVGELLAVVEGLNESGGRVKMSAGHVTVDEDAEVLLGDVKGFMARVLRGEVKCVDEGWKRGEKFGMWVEKGGRFKLGAPVGVVERGRDGILRGEWDV